MFGASNIVMEPREDILLYIYKQQLRLLPVNGVISIVSNLTFSPVLLVQVIVIYHLINRTHSQVIN